MLGELIRLIRSPMVGAKRKSASGSFAGGDSVGGRGVDLEGANHGFGLQEVPDHESTCTTQRLRGIFVES